MIGFQFSRAGEFMSTAQSDPFGVSSDESINIVSPMIAEGRKFPSSPTATGTSGNEPLGMPARCH